jgi:hypothetical protein
MSELVLLGLVERAEAVLYAQAERLSETNRRLEPRIPSISTGQGPGQEGGWILAHRITCEKRFINGNRPLVSTRWLRERRINCGVSRVFDPHRPYQNLADSAVFPLLHVSKQAHSGAVLRPSCAHVFQKDSCRCKFRVRKADSRNQ